MSSQDLIRVFFALIFGIAMGWAVYARRDWTEGEGLENSRRQRYVPYLWGGLLPCFFLALVAMGLVFYGRQMVVQVTAPLLYSVLLQISLYYLLLLPFLPLLRRYVSARACAMLWMLPNYLYITQQSFLARSRPGVVLSLPGRLVWELFWVWLVGALAFFLWKVIAHLRFRARLLRGAREALDPEVYRVWTQELAAANVRKPKFRLVISPNTATPLSVGLFQWSIRVVLPQRPYTREELSLILRHELVHIGRQDAWNKFFLLFCTALCWFNPLMWVASKKSAEDLELSCDETVLLEADEGTRTRYARLLLDTAGDARGFTTCLSASASSLRYRLQRIVRPRRAMTGGVLLGLVFFGLCMSAGYVALAWGGGTGAEAIYQSQDPQRCTLSAIARTQGGDTTYLRCGDPQAFTSYLTRLPMEQLMGNYTFDEEEESLSMNCSTSEGIVYVTLWEHAARVATLAEAPRTTRYYHLPQATDWAYLDSLLVPEPAG